MPIGFVGTDHSHASLALRERLSLGAGRLGALLDALRADPLIAEAAVLSTCNRVEIYVAAPDVSAALACAADHLVRATGVPSHEIAGVLERGVDGDAARHLFAVAAGLRSLALGETQIVTQVREAFEYAAACEASGPWLQALARAAVTCAKRVRSETALGVADTSVSSLVVAMAQQRLGSLAGRSALLIGAGRINEVSAQLLHEAGIGSLVSVSRTRAAAARLAALYGGRDEAMEDLADLLAGVDVAIAAMRSPQPLVLPSMMRPRPAGRPLLLYDIAMPRNVDPAVGMLPGVELIDMDGVRASSPHNSDALDGIAACWAIVDSHVERYLVDARTRRAVPLIAALRAHVDRQKEAELARTLASLVHLAPDDRDAVALLAHRLVNRMFHHLASRLKAVASAPDAESYLEALTFLFDTTGPEYATVTAPASELDCDDGERSDTEAGDPHAAGASVKGY